MKSEFGKGFVYNLVLFAKHYEKFKEDLRINDEMAEKYPENWKKGESTLWFNGAGDHFFELEIPKDWQQTEIGKLAKELCDEALERRLGKTTHDEFIQFFRKLENLCLLIDKKLGVNPIKATWN